MFYIKSGYHKVMKKNIITTGMSFLVIIFLMSSTTTYAQNMTTTAETIDVESVKPPLDEAKKAFDSGNYTEALC
jgi:hypothetical protein